jgi:hypothetical protein
MSVSFILFNSFKILFSVLSNNVIVFPDLVDMFQISLFKLWVLEFPLFAGILFKLSLEVFHQNLKLNLPTRFEILHLLDDRVGDVG